MPLKNSYAAAKRIFVDLHVGKGSFHCGLMYSISRLSALSEHELKEMSSCAVVFSTTPTVRLLQYIHVIVISTYQVKTLICITVFAHLVAFGQSYLLLLLILNVSD